MLSDKVGRKSSVKITRYFIHVTFYLVKVLYDS